MRHALILAGGSGTRLWPMSRRNLPKQLIPFLAGKSLLELAFERLEGLIPRERIHVCAANRHREAILGAVSGLAPQRFIGEPVGRDTLSAIGLGAAVLRKADPDAVIGVFTSDHVIEPIDEFQRIVGSGYETAENTPAALVTFGVTPSCHSQAYGYLELGKPLAGDPGARAARIVERFREKPDALTAKAYFEAGPQRYLWNSGMFVWRAATVLDCMGRYEPDVFHGLSRIADAWGTPRGDAVMADIYPGLKKISIDFAVMEPASQDPTVRVVALPMPLKWLDVGSWTSFALTCPRDALGNALAGGRHLLYETSRTLVASSDPGHVIATIGLKDTIVIHTPDATLVCRAEDAEAVKEIHRLVGEQLGPECQ